MEGTSNVIGTLRVKKSDEVKKKEKIGLPGYTKGV